MKAATFTLTQREREVADLVAAGLTNRQIATKLFVAERTAEYHVEQIRNKLGFHSRSEIAAWVVAEQHRPAGNGSLPKTPALAVIPPAARARPSRRLAAFLVAGVVVVTAIGIGLAPLLNRTPGPAPVPPFRVIQVNTATGQLTSWSASMSGRATSVVAGEGGLWSVSYADRVLTRIDPTTAAVIGTYGLPAPPVGLAVGGGMVWIATAFGDSPVVPFDPKTNRPGQPVSVGSEAALQDVAYGWNSVWVSDKNNNRVYRIDPVTGTVISRIAVGEGPEGIALDPTAVWVANALDSTVSRIDPGSAQVVATIGLPGAPTAVAAGSGAVWVAIDSAHLIVRIDPATNAHIEIPIEGHPSDIAVTPSTVWVANAPTGRIIRIDPATNRVLSPASIGASIDAMSTDAATLWVTVHGS